MPYGYDLDDDSAGEPGDGVWDPRPAPTPTPAPVPTEPGEGGYGYEFGEDPIMAGGMGLFAGLY